MDVRANWSGICVDSRVFVAGIHPNWYPFRTDAGGNEFSDTSFYSVTLHSIAPH
jgi:hypothetical protein